MGKEKVKLGRLKPNDVVRVINALTEKADSHEKAAQDDTVPYSNPWSTALLDRSEAKKVRKLSRRLTQRFERFYHKKRRGKHR